MAKAFSVASWNVEHFKNVRARVDRVVQFIDEQRPDVCALYEVEGSEVFVELTRRMPGYTFHITEGRNTQEILLGVRSSMTAFFTQRTEFRSGNLYLRPGALLTVTKANVDYTLLFLHTKSSSKPVGLGLRDDMFERALKFRQVLERNATALPVNYIFLGDLNTMGMQYKYLRDRDIDATQELAKLDSGAARAHMRRLSKDQPATWWGGGAIPPSDLDQVIAADHLSFRTFQGANVAVRGWPALTGAARRNWVERYSDHALLYFEIQEP